MVVRGVDMGVRVVGCEVVVVVIRCKGAGVDRGVVIGCKVEGGGAGVGVRMVTLRRYSKNRNQKETHFLFCFRCGS